MRNPRKLKEPKLSNIIPKKVDNKQVKKNQGGRRSDEDPQVNICIHNLTNQNRVFSDYYTSKNREIRKKERKEVNLIKIVIQ